MPSACDATGLKEAGYSRFLAKSTRPLQGARCSRPLRGRKKERHPLKAPSGRHRTSFRFAAQLFGHSHNRQRQPLTE